MRSATLKAYHWLNRSRQIKKAAFKPWFLESSNDKFRADDPNGSSYSGQDRIPILREYVGRLHNDCMVEFKPFH